MHVYIWKSILRAIDVYGQRKPRKKTITQSLYTQLVLAMEPNSNNLLSIWSNPISNSYDNAFEHCVDNSCCYMILKCLMQNQSITSQRSHTLVVCVCVSIDSRSILFWSLIIFITHTIAFFRLLLFAYYFNICYVAVHRRRRQ